jgi:tetratricopeptide (TPR) repeat protein
MPALDRGLTSFPASSEMLTNRARIWLRRRDARRARSDAERAVELKPSSALANFVFGMAMDVLGDRETAQRAFTAAARADPGLLQAHEALAVMSIRAGDYGSALSQFEAAATIAPDNETIHLALGATYFKLGDGVRARQEVEHARQLIPLRYISNFAYTSVGRFTSEIGELDEYCGNFILSFKHANPEWSLNDLEIPMVRALAGARDVATFKKFEQALFDSCVVPIYHLSSSFGATQLLRFENRTPECLRTKGVMCYWITEDELSLDKSRVPWPAEPKVDAPRLNSFFAHRGESRPGS